MSDGSSMDFGFDPGAGAMPDYGQDVATTGAGADPFGSGGDGGVATWGTGGAGDGSDISNYPEAASTGNLPGGTDSQLTPFSPGGGFDFTNVLGGAGALQKAGLFGPNGSIYDTNRPNIGTGPYPQARPRGGFDSYGPSSPRRAGAAMTYTGQYAGQGVGELVRWVRQSSGLRVTAQSIVGLIVRYGFRAAAALTRLDMSGLLAIFMSKKGVRHHRRGPGLYTVSRKLRAADRLAATVSRIMSRARSCAPRRSSNQFHARRKRR